MNTVAIIEDNDPIRNVLSNVFVSNNWIVSCYSNGEEFIQLNNKKLFSLIVVDLCLPGISGIRLLQNHFHKKQKSIVMSGFISMYLGNELFNTNDTSFISKPFTIDEMKSLIKKMTYLEFK